MAKLTDTGSPISPEGMGGIFARYGFEFQDRWVLHEAISQLKEDSFKGFVNEGIDDVEIHWAAPGRRNTYLYDFFHLKNKTLSASELAELVGRCEHKRRVLRDDACRRCGIVTPRCHPSLGSLSTKIQRVRNSIQNHGEDSPISLIAIQDLTDLLRNLGIASSASFVLEELDFNFSASWILLDDVFWTVLSSRLKSVGVRNSALTDAVAHIHPLAKQYGKLVTSQDIHGVLAKYVRKKPSTMPSAEILEKQAIKDLAKQARPQTATKTPSSHSAQSRDGACKITVYPGNATVVRLPQGEYGVFDCGLRATLRMLPPCAQLRIEHLKFLAFSHFDRDHVDGLSGVLSQFKSIESIYLPANALRPAGGGAVATLMAYAKQHRGCRLIRLEVEGSGPSVIHSSRDDRNVEVAQVVAMSPSFFDLYGVSTRHFDPNDNSSVFAVTCGEKKFLVTGDASLKCWSRILRNTVGRSRALNADGFTVPHHGSRRSLSVSVIEAIARKGAFLAVLDRIPRNPYGHPHESVLQAIRDAGGKILVCETDPVVLVLSSDGLFHQADL